MTDRVIEHLLRIEQANTERLQIKNGHLQHRFNTLNAWARASDSVSSQAIVDLLSEPIPLVWSSNNNV